MDLGVGHVEYRVEQHAAKLGGRHRSSVVELSIRNRAVVGSNPTGGSCPSGSIPDTWVTVYSEHIGNTFGPKG